MESIFVAFIILATIVAISLIVVRLNKKDKNRERAELVSRFRQLVLDHELSVFVEEVSDNFAIGLDEEKGKLLILKRLKKNNYDSIVTGLNEIKSFKKREVYGQYSTGRAVMPKYLLQLEKIVLDLEFYNDREPFQIPFYNYIDNNIYEIADMKKRVSRWETLLTNQKQNLPRKSA